MPKFSNRITDVIASRISANWATTFATEAAAYPGVLDSDELARFTTIDWDRQFLREEIPVEILTQENYSLPLFFLNTAGGQTNQNFPNRGILLGSLIQATLKVKWDTFEAIEPALISNRSSAIQGIIESTILGIICNPATRSNFGPGISFNSIVEWSTGTLAIAEAGYSATESYTFTFALAV